MASAKEFPKIKLSICIPTLNRGSFIGETLGSIACQLTSEVEVVIVDGGSVDNTIEVVKQFQRNFPNIRYFRNVTQQRDAGSIVPSGLGFDRDCNRAVELAAGEYCWLFTDDDLLKPGAVARIIDAIQHRHALIVVNAEVRSSNLAHTLEPARLKASDDRVYLHTEGERLFTDVADYLSFVGGVVIRRQLWLESEKEQHIGTGFVHIAVLFQRPIAHTTLVLAEPLIVIRYGNAQYMRSSRYFEIWMFIWPNLIWSLPCFSEAAKGSVCRKEPWRRYRTLLLYRAKGAYSIREYRTWLQMRLNSSWRKLAAKIIACFPGAIANSMAIIYHRVSGRRSALEHVDLVKSPYFFARPLQLLAKEGD
jgi:abequosyltransferase